MTIRKNQLTLAALTLVLGLARTSFAADKLILTCGSVPSQDIESIEVYENDHGGSVMVQQLDEVGTVSWLDVDEVCISVECVIPLPPNGKQDRVLENRHTGWKVTVYDGGVASHLAIDCE